MAVTFDEAMSRLRATRSVTLPGAPATWSSTTRILFYVLAGLLVLVVLMALVAIPVAVSASGGSLPLGAIFGVLSVLVMGAGVVYWFTRRKKDQGSYHSQERQEVVLSPAGITLRGVGPIPWADFGPAGHRMVEAEYQSGRIRRAVMELTPRGRVNVNERLDPQLRPLISPPMGPFWNRHHRYIYVPGVEGLSESEVIELINAAGQMFTSDT